MMVGSALVAVPVYLTGEAAEDTVRMLSVGSWANCGYSIGAVR
jgi:hypothetical protein